MIGKWWEWKQILEIVYKGLLERSGQRKIHCLTFFSLTGKPLQFAGQKDLQHLKWKSWLEKCISWLKEESIVRAVPPGAPFYTQINNIRKWLWRGLESNRIIPEEASRDQAFTDMLLGIPPKWWEQCQEEGARQSSRVQGTENQIRKGSNGFSTKKWLPKTTAAIPIVPDPFLRLLG